MLNPTCYYILQSFERFRTLSWGYIYDIILCWQVAGMPYRPGEPIWHINFRTIIALHVFDFNQFCSFEGMLPNMNKNWKWLSSYRSSSFSSSEVTAWLSQLSRKIGCRSLTDPTQSMSTPSDSLNHRSPSLPKFCSFNHLVEAVTYM